MKSRLQTTLGQQLAITPQMQQAIRLLQMPVAELAVELAEAVASNPLLEWADTAPIQTNHTDSNIPSENAAAKEEPTLPPDETVWHGHSSGRRFDDGDSSDDDPSARLVDSPDLHDHLRWHLQLMPLSQRDQAIGLALIDAIDADGYLREPLETIAAILSPQWRVAEDEVLVVLGLIQRLEPTGIGARTLSECLQLQLQAFPVQSDDRELALLLARDWLEQLPRSGADGIARQLRQPIDAVTRAIALLRSLDPRPGSQFAPLTSDHFVLPDVTLERRNGHWQARLGAHAGPPIVIQQAYAQMIDHCSPADASYLRGQLQQARWLVKGLQARGQTLLRVAQCLITHQAGYLEFGDQALQTLTLREIAQELDLHESTVSRAIAGKYVHTPRGTVPMRHFFAQGVVGEDGQSASSTAIQAVIRRLIDDENPRKPLSDSHLVKQLADNGITVARRTVAKYREAMSIPPSHERVRMG